MSDTERPWSVTVRLDDVAETGRHVELEASEEVRAALAKPAGVDAIERLDRDASISPGAGATACMSSGRGQRDGAADLRGHARAGGERRSTRRSMWILRRRASAIKRVRRNRASMSSAGRGAGAADRQQCRSRPARDRVPDPRDRSLSAQAGCRLRCARRLPSRPATRLRRSPHWRKRAQSRNNCRTLGALCVRPPNRYCPAARRAISTYRTACQNDHGPKGPNCARCHGGRRRACGRGSRAPIFRSRAIPTPNSSCSATRPWSGRCSTRGRG